MTKCEICNLTFTNKGNLFQHTKKCKKLFEIKDEIINLYINENYSIKELRAKFKVQSDDIKNILGDKIRTLSDASKVAHKKYPEKYVHSDKTKKILREKRLNFMKNNPEKTAWRLSNVSYPEKLFIEYIELIGFDKKFSIIREYPIFPYFIDFAFVNEMVAIEIDGSQHLLPERKERDNNKDKLLNELGWLVIRISEKEIKNNIQNVFEQIIPIIIKKPKTNNIKIGLVINPKKYYKKERNQFGFTETQIESFQSQRKQVRPSLILLLKQIDELGFTGAGKLYNVSDNTIRKWVRAYKKGID